MAVCDSGLQAGKFPSMPTYSDWIQCFTSSKAEGQLKRGPAYFPIINIGHSFET